jgi:chromosome segregation ATPase
MQQYSGKIVEIKRTYKRELRALEKSLRQTKLETEHQVKALQAEMAEKDAAMEHLNQQALESTKRLEVLNAQLENRERYEQEQRKQLNFGNDLKIAELQGQIGKLETENTDCLNALKSAKQQLQQVQAERSRLQSRVAELESDLQNLSAQFSRKAHEKKLAHIAVVDTAKQQNRDLQANQLKLSATIQQLEEAQSNLAKERDCLKLELVTAKVQSRGVDEKLRSELSTVTFQSAAQVAALRSEFEGLLSKLYAQIERLCRSMDLTQEVTPETDIELLFHTLVEKYQNGARDRSLCATQLNELARLRNVLKLKSTDPIIPSIVRLLDANQAALAEIEKMKLDSAEQLRTIDQLKRYERETDAQLIGLKQWEIWARRLLRMKRGIENEIVFDEVRLLLEEDLLASNSSTESYHFQIALLRVEKQILLKFGKTIITRSPSPKLSLKALVMSARFVVRNCLNFSQREDEIPALPLVLRNLTDVPPSEVSPILRPKILLRV